MPTPEEDRRIVEKGFSFERHIKFNLVTIPLDGEGGAMKFTLDVWVKMLTILPAIISEIESFIKSLGLTGMGATKSTITVAKVATEVGATVTEIAPLIQPVIDASVKAMNDIVNIKPSE